MEPNPYEAPKVADPRQANLSVPIDGRHCPACGENIGIGPIGTEIIPGRCRCPYCHTKLTWKGAYTATLIMIVLTLAILGGAVLVVRSLGIENRWLAGAVLGVMALPPTLIVGWIGAALQARYSILRRL